MALLLILLGIFLAGLVTLVIVSSFNYRGIWAVFIVCFLWLVIPGDTKYATILGFLSLLCYFSRSDSNRSRSTSSDRFTDR